MEVSKDSEQVILIDLGNETKQFKFVNLYTLLVEVRKCFPGGAKGLSFYFDSDQK